MGDWPVMNAARPAVQLCWPYQSVNKAPSLANRSMFGVRYPITPWLYALRLNHPMSSPQITRMLGFFPTFDSAMSRSCFLFLLRNSRCDQRDNGGKTEAGVPWADDSQNCCFYEQIGARQARGPGAGRGD